jgi:uncharacterized membrane protein
MKVGLVLVLVLMLIFCWLFSTSLVVNGENNKMAFKFKSLFYWIAVTISFLVGFFLNR